MITNSNLYLLLLLSYYLFKELILFLLYICSYPSVGSIIKMFNFTPYCGLYIISKLYIYDINNLFFNYLFIISIGYLFLEFIYFIYYIYLYFDLYLLFICSISLNIRYKLVLIEKEIKYNDINNIISSYKLKIDDINKQWLNIKSKYKN
jgi:hypothetical protein